MDILLRTHRKQTITAYECKLPFSALMLEGHLISPYNDQIRELYLFRIEKETKTQWELDSELIADTATNWR